MTTREKSATRKPKRLEGKSDQSEVDSNVQILIADETSLKQVSEIEDPSEREQVDERREGQTVQSDQESDQQGEYRDFEHTFNSQLSQREVRIKKSTARIQYRRTCGTCQGKRGRNVNTKQPLTGDLPGYRVHNDVCGTFVTSRIGNKYTR